MPDYSYLSLAKLKTNFDLATSDTTQDTAQRRVLEAASLLIDQETHRTFRVYLATRYYTARSGSRLLLPDDLLAVTTLKTLTANSGGTRTYGDTWAAVDYDLEPYNAAVDLEPYTVIARNPEGDYSFPTGARGVELAGRWGYWQDLETVASTTAEVLDATETAVDVTAGTDFAILDTILVDSEQMYVTGIASNTLTVVRGVNGTTAATHVTASVVQRYRYPALIAEACGMQASRMFNRSRNAPGGVTQSAEFGIVRPVRLDADVRVQIEPYRALKAA